MNSCVSRWTYGIALTLFTALFAVLYPSSTAFAQCGEGEGEGELPPCTRPIHPQVSCITDNFDGSYTASWGYVSDNNLCCPLYELPIRTEGTPQDPRANFFAPAPIDRGQPSFFAPGTHLADFDITWDGTPLTWTLRYFTITPPFFAEESVTADASNTNQLCPPPPPPPCELVPTVEAECGGTQTTVDLEVNPGNADPYGYQWSITCDDPAAQLSGVTTQTPQITLFNPGLGVPASCSAEVEVTGLGSSSTCSTNVSVTPCNLDCLGQINGTAQFDQCGVCNGSNECLDCLGQPFGTAQVDRCGVCQGDGQSCLGCQDVMIAEQQVTLDSNANQQRDLIASALYRYRKLAKGKAGSGAFIKSVRKEVNALAIEVWVLSWSLPQTITTCTNTIFCASFDNSFLLDQILTKFSRLRDLSGIVAKRITRLAQTRKQRRAAKRIIAQGEALHSSNLSALSSIPPITSSCTQ